MTAQLFMQADQTVGVMSFVKRVKQLQIGVPLAQPRLATLRVLCKRYFQFRVLKNLQRQSVMPRRRLEVQVTLLVLF